MFSVVTTLIALIAPAQQPSPWQGEWGDLGFHMAGLNTPEGGRLSIHDCDQTGCSFSIQRYAVAGLGGTNGERRLRFQSDTAAEAKLPPVKGSEPCRLQLKRIDVPVASIEVRATGRACSDYLTNDTVPEARMDGIYPLHTRAVYHSFHADDCFMRGSPGLLAICTHPELEALERKWSLLTEEYPLHASVNVAHEDEVQDQNFLYQCDSAPEPAGCLSTIYTAEIAEMDKLSGITIANSRQRGDPIIGGQLAAKIAGYYHRDFSDVVKGRLVTRTDSLTIQRVGPASIHFDAVLHFDSGYRCKVSGGALYRQNGSFVFDDILRRPYETSETSCHLAIVPTSVGVSFRDPNAACREYCNGDRIGWDGSGFQLKERTP